MVHSDVEDFDLNRGPVNLCVWYASLKLDTILVMISSSLFFVRRYGEPQTRAILGFEFRVYVAVLS